MQTIYGTIKKHTQSPKSFTENFTPLIRRMNLRFYEQMNVLSITEALNHLVYQRYYCM